MNACKNCGSVSLYIEERGSQVGLYCTDCGKWIKWVSKDERRVIEKAIQQNNMTLVSFSNEELLAEILRRMKHV